MATTKNMFSINTTERAKNLNFRERLVAMNMYVGYSGKPIKSFLNTRKIWVRIEVPDTGNFTRKTLTNFDEKRKVGIKFLSQFFKIFFDV
jgi:hypothetical protein